MPDTELDRLMGEYEKFKGRGLVLDISRGKPSGEQLDLSVPMLRETDGGFICSDGADARNYADATGIPEAKRLFAELLGVPCEQVIIGGSSSLNLIHDALSRALINGPMECDTPWARLPEVKIICPVPGYDWHFGMVESLGMKVAPVMMDSSGPDMDAVRALAADPSVKGMICGPMYGNPSGITYSDAVVDALASMETAADDFRIIWDNAYCVHHLYPEKSRRDRLKNLYEACVKAGNEDRVLMFTSTSKITFAGGGVSAMAASPRNIARHASLMNFQIVCYDKVNQLRHARFLPNMAAVEEHMMKQADIIRPKFELVLDTFERELNGIARWTRPRGGYFICFWAPKGCAKRVVELCKDAGVTLTPAGSPYPGGYDPDDSIIRIAPTFPPMSELEQVMELLPLAVKIAFAEKNAI